MTEKQMLARLERYERTLKEIAALYAGQVAGNLAIEALATSDELDKEADE